eukprot:TRINITY_DN4334_c0_g1_i3.p4 TRINITY_DN4334_c0_g1~~TRINITY_DN4334_c0_g1_i3.p4  ORF type:complete len:153 (-),score=18.09 TRINITY_DN4334_c0_g1_i3:95-553(-)
MYFILSGQVEISKNQHKGSAIQTLKDNSIFGQIEFFNGKWRNHYAKSLTVTHLIYLNFDEFREKLEEFPDDFGSYFYIRDQINIYSNYSILQQRCESCNKYSHHILNCPLLSVIPKQQLIIDKILIQQKQKRKFVLRKLTKKTESALGCKKQ